LPPLAPARLHLPVDFSFQLTSDGPAKKNGRLRAMAPMNHFTAVIAAIPIIMLLALLVRAAVRGL